MDNKAKGNSTRLITRRDYLKRSVAGTAGLFVAPTIISLSGCSETRTSPNGVINIGQIGCGRIARGHDLPETIKNENVRIVAVSDLDALRMEEGKQWVEAWYLENKGSATYTDVRMYQDYRELLAQSDIDAVVISTPDHQHFLPALEAAIAGKHIYMQKPFSLTVQEGRILSNNLRRLGTVFQVGSQQRSQDPWPHFKRACELVRNGRVGSLHTVRVGLPGDPPGGDPTPMPIPERFDYDHWLGSTPDVPYTLDRVHPTARISSDRPILRQGFGRGGWLRCEQFSAGMITGWGAHHVDTAHWGMDTEFTGPIEITAEAEFATGGLWDVHGDFNVEAKYANGVTMLISGVYPNGVRFEGEDGWIFVTRSGAPVTSTDPDTREFESPIQASDPAILESVIGPNEIHLYESPEQHTNWVQCITSGEPTVAPVEVAHRSTSACLLAHIAMKLPRTLYWNPEIEQFRDDDEANSMLSRPQRSPYSIDNVEGVVL